MVRLLLRRSWAGLAPALVVTATLAQTVPPGFTDVQIVPGGGASGALGPTAIAYEPGGDHLWICEKGPGTASGSARIRRRDAVSFAVSTALTLTVDSRGERGILGIAFDPDFLDPSGLSRFVYVYYTVPTPVPHNRVSRFAEAAGILSAEQVILEGPTLNAATNHNGGCLRFRADKTLYIAMGDNDTDGDANPMSRDMSDLRGKILRIHRDGTIPSDNPFVGVLGAREEIYEFGMRNPWRFHVDPDNDALVIADVGEGCFESVYLGLAGADHGYPCFEGIRPFRACSGTLPPGSVTFPVYWYGHQTTGACSTPPVDGLSITGGPVYRATAFPPEYRGNYYFADYARGWIRRARIAGDGSLSDVELFLSGGVGAVDMAVSPAGCLTYAAFNAGGVHDVCFVGGINGQPEAVASATPIAGLGPLDVQFTGSLSSDPDFDPLTFAWDFGDLGTDTIADPLHQYVPDGVYQAVLTVDDGQGAPNSQDSAPPIRIVVGNRPPLPIIAAPADGSPYDAGATIGFSGSASDPEDGVIPATGFEWTVVFHHGTHRHPFLGPIRGVTSGSFDVPATGEDATDVFYRIWLTVTDSGNPVGRDAALEASTSVDILPNVTTTTLAADPPVPGLQLGWDGSLADAPHSHPSVAGFRRRITAPTPQVIGPDTWEFVSWSDAGAADHVIAAPTSDATLTAAFTCTSGCVETGRCADGLDNEFDGLADCADPDCFADSACIEAGNCFDTVDNDLDGLADCADPECFVEPSCIEAGNCADGVDNDVDGLVDCADADCYGDPACGETGFCEDGLDNDADTLADCADTDCATDPACVEVGECTDTIDNDGDGQIDCADADCVSDPACIEAGNCFDAVDNDLDGMTDCLDPECFGEPACIEAGNCGDAVDNDVDGLTDCLDPDCAAEPACIEAGNCGDAVDNDVDGFTDCLDPDCAAEPACIEAGNCDDTVDNDVDGLTDCLDPDCALDLSCNESLACADAIDNDGDGAADCDDLDCIADPACASADYDGDGEPNATDCAPADGTAFAVPPEVAGLSVAKLPVLGPFGVRLQWPDQVPLSGTGAVVDVASALVSTLARATGADAPCIATDMAGTTYDDRSAVADDALYFLVRGGTACGEGPWGSDSRGAGRPACP